MLQIEYNYLVIESLNVSEVTCLTRRTPKNPHIDYKKWTHKWTHKTNHTRARSDARVCVKLCTIAHHTALHSAADIRWAIYVNELMTN